MRNKRTLSEWAAMLGRWIGDLRFSALGVVIVVGLIVLVVVAILLINHFHAVPAPRTTITKP